MYKATGDVVGGCGAFLKVAEITTPPLDEISAMASWLNTAPELRVEMDIVERATLFRPLARLMEVWLSAASATDLSRLAWLYLHSGDGRRALEVADLGLEREPENNYCQRLVERLRGPPA